MLNQAQIINAVKRFYGDRTGLDPRMKTTKVALSSHKNKSLQNSDSKKKSQKSEQTMQGSIMTSDYVDYYHRVKEFAKK